MILFDPGWEIGSRVIITAQGAVVFYQSYERILGIHFSKEGVIKAG